MDRNIVSNYLILPLVYYFLLSLGMVGISGYMLVSSSLKQTFAKELDNAVVSINLKKDSDKLSVTVRTKDEMRDPRAKQLEHFFTYKATKDKNDNYVKRSTVAPLADYSDKLVETADKFKIDWKIVAAISMKESNGGSSKTAIAYNNPCGWGVRDGAELRNESVYKMSSWEEAIDKISFGIQCYYEKQLVSPAEIVTKYNPGAVQRANGIAADTDWAKDVQSFMDDIASRPSN